MRIFLIFPALAFICVGGALVWQPHQKPEYEGLVFVFIGFAILIGWLIGVGKEAPPKMGE